MNTQPVVLVEFNELSPILMENFLKEGRLPNLKRLYDQSEICISAAEEQEPNLDPWIQWVNVHTGVPYAEHGVFNLSEGHKLRQKCLWDLVSEAGSPVWVCGSMNVRYDDGIRGYILPDPWATDCPPYPGELKAYFHFIQQNVLEYTNERVPLTKSDYINFVKFMVGHGLSLHTVTATLQQLLAEKRTGRGRWRRAFIMDKMQFDMFSAVYRRIKPRFSTFFLNSTAHMQHAYWRHMQPELYKVATSEAEQREYGSAILLGYKEMDGLMGRMLKLVGDEAIVILATALSQQPCLRFEEKGGKHGYYVKDYPQLLKFAGIQHAHRVAPVMSGQFWVHLENDEAAAEVQGRLSALRVGGELAIRTRREGTSVFASCCVFKGLEQDAVLHTENGEQSTPFFGLFYASDITKSAMHHPDGILWIRHPHKQHSVRSEKVGLIRIAPTILDMLGVSKVEQMKGASLLTSSREATDLVVA
jgi:hypothetical protein